MKHILNDAKFQRTLDELAKGEQLNRVQVNLEAEEYLKELYTEQKPMGNMLGVQAVQYVLGRGYNKSIDVNPAELRTLTKLMYRHPIAFVMTHKTYIDMAVLGLVLARYGLPLPYTFAGINLDFPGLGGLGRSSGVIFIRRSFKDNLVYKSSLRHYIKSLVDNKASFMWAIEGTRSRTGKLVWPQMGILKYIMEADQQSKENVKYIPVSIVYDLIPDVKEMTLEGRGKKKRSEDLAWLMDYVKKMGNDMGKISLRFGDPVEINEHTTAPIPDNEDVIKGDKISIPHTAFELVHRINQVTPVTTTSLICATLLSKFGASKQGIESDVADLMQLIESHKPDALVDRGKPIGESVQVALNLLVKAQLCNLNSDGAKARYTISIQHYLQATYYANMAAHHLYHRAFIELALVKVLGTKAQDRPHAFWEMIMQLRDLFKFEFFYSSKLQFTEEIEADLKFIDPNWNELLKAKKSDLEKSIQQLKLIIAPVVLYNYIESYRVVAQALLQWNPTDRFKEKHFTSFCLTLGEEMHWQGRIRRLEAISKPFLVNGIRLIKNQNLIPTKKDDKKKAILAFMNQLDEMAEGINQLQKTILNKEKASTEIIPIERAIVPGSRTVGITREILEGEEGAHIGAFFDLDRTLIRDFSAKEFVRSRVMSGKMSSKEIIAQFSGVLVYASGDRNFAALAAVSANGVKGLPEEVFIEVGEEVYLEHLADSIYAESRALVAAHLAKGHTVAIVSAATPYQVNPIARDLGIEHVMCTRMEVENGRFTGKIVEPACWGEGKAYAGRQLAEQYNLDMDKSFFYTDSAEDLPLLEIVGNPRPLNPDPKLSTIAFKSGWPIYRFDDEQRRGVANAARTLMTFGSLFPAALSGLAKGVSTGSWQSGVNSMMATLGDLATNVAGISLAVKGEEHLEHRPAVFILNHQSNADLLIASKLIRYNAVGIAKKELKMFPVIGQLMMAAGVIFIDRKDKQKAIDAMKPAVDALKAGTSIIIFPEGTRSNDYKLGRFKKGAFHLAMQAGVPIIPIVVYNAHEVVPKGSMFVKPTVVRTSVYPPIPTTDWTKENMEEKIKEVRELFLKELGQD